MVAAAILLDELASWDGRERNLNEVDEILQESLSRCLLEVAHGWNPP
jgi:hypothetical protein